MIVHPAFPGWYTLGRLIIRRLCIRVPYPVRDRLWGLSTRPTAAVCISCWEGFLSHPWAGVSK